MNDIFQIFNKFIKVMNDPLPPTQNVKSILQTFTSSDSFWYERLTVLQSLSYLSKQAGG